MQLNKCLFFSANTCIHTGNSFLGSNFLDQKNNNNNNNNNSSRPDSMSSLLSPLLLLFLTALPYTTLSQNPSTMANCGPRLLPLVPCATFVQGTVPSPAQPCCDNLKQLYNQQPSCLCLLLNNTTIFSSFPINSTLALQLPLLCSLQVDSSTCSGVPLPSTSPVPQVSNATHPNSTIAASPAVTVAPRPSNSIMGFGFGRSDGKMLKTKGHLVLLVSAIAFMSL